MKTTLILFVLSISLYSCKKISNRPDNEPISKEDFISKTKNLLGDNRNSLSRDTSNEFIDYEVFTQKIVENANYYHTISLNCGIVMYNVRLNYYCN